MFEGVPNYPDMSRFWKVVEKYKVNIFYTAPTAIRAIAKEGDEWVKKHDLSSLRILGTVGEPINPEAWNWYYNLIGRGECPIVDTWWQTETGGILITPLPGAIDIKPGMATVPFFGVEPVHARRRGQGDPRDGSQRRPVHQDAVARHHAGRLRRPQAVPGDLLRAVPRLLLHR